MLSFTIGTLIILASICFFLSVAFNAAHSLYKRYKFITSSEFKTISAGMTETEKLNYTYKGLSKLIGALFFIVIGMLLLDTPTSVILIPAIILFIALYYNSKILQELKRS